MRKLFLLAVLLAACLRHQVKEGCIKYTDSWYACCPKGTDIEISKSLFKEYQCVPKEERNEEEAREAM